MKLRKYKVVYLNNSFYEMVKIYPMLVSLLYKSQNDIFETKQIELLFLPIHKEKEMFLDVLKKREDYTYYHGIHRLLNPITNENIEIIIHEYDIEVCENEGKNIIFDILKEISKNFYMIEL